MLFVKKAKIKEAKEFPNLALQKEGLVTNRVNEPSDAKKYLSKGNVVPIVTNDNRNDRTEKLIALAQTKLFGRKTKYLNLSQVDLDYAVPVAERIASGWSVNKWVEKARYYNSKFYNANLVTSVGHLPRIPEHKLRKAVSSLVLAYYLNATVDKIYELIMNTLPYYNFGDSRYFGYVPYQCKYINRHIADNETIEFDSLTTYALYSTWEIHNNPKGFSANDVLHMLIYQAVKSEMPLASKYQVYQDYLYIANDVQSLIKMQEQAYNVLARKRNSTVSQANVKDMIKHLTLNRFKDVREIYHTRGSSKYGLLEKGTPTTNKLVDDIPDEELSEKYEISYGELRELDTAEQHMDSFKAMALPDYINNDLSEKIIQEANDNFKKNIFNGYGDSGVHGTALIHKFVPNRRDKVAEMKLHRQLSDSGVKPKNIHRILTDRKVFARRKKIAGGSVLIDFSGSMGWDTPQVKEIIRILPASVIAGYTGYSDARFINGKKYHGDIRIIADKGKYDDNAIDQLFKHGNNNIDYQALQWLSQQEEPRIWVSDQQVIGVSSTTQSCAIRLGKQQRADIARIMSRNNIIPIEDYEYAKEFATQYANHIG